MGGSSGGTTTEVVYPEVTAQPTTAEAMKAYVDSLPALYEAQLKYAPLEAEQQIKLAQQYAVPYAEAQKQAQEALYPGTSALQEKLAKQANEGMTGKVPDSARQQYRSDLLAQLGTNAMSGVGADYVSRGLMNQQQEYNQYYQNLGLSLAGRQPLTQATTPTTTNYMGSYTPSQGLSYSANTYGTYAGASRPFTTTEQSGTPNWALGLNAAGNLMSGFGSMFGGGQSGK
jgi:hypothetical protein